MHKTEKLGKTYFRHCHWNNAWFAWIYFLCFDTVHTTITVNNTAELNDFKRITYMTKVLHASMFSVMHKCTKNKPLYSIYYLNLEI